MKKPIAIIFNDAHLKAGNEENVISSVKHMIEVANEMKIKKFIFAGDLFDSRSFQRQSILLTLDKILNLFLLNDIESYFIPGNHDKTTYASYDSFLDTFRHYPNFNLYTSLSVIDIEGVSVTMLPFFSDDMLIPMLKEAKPSDVLISHFEMAGSTNLGRASEKTTINKELLSKWKKTYLGHYHNHHEITKDIVHLPSLRQANFGEDNNKGFSVLYDDLSYDVIRGNFSEFLKINIDLNSITTTELKQLIKTYQNSSDVVRFEFTGKESKLKALDRSMFQDTGIDIKLKYDAKYDYDEDDLVYPTITEMYQESDVKDTFKQFCEDKGYDLKIGQALLDEFFNK